ncbi:hypothetical protein [Actinomadura formosensis]|uniref:hypothetical protein n=1 Tax=Actinomadura formosensis TaxID=60706 RepID=UPI003D92FB9B
MAEQIHGHALPALDVEDVLADPAGACPNCIRIVIERLRATLAEDPDRAQLLHELDVQRAAMATMLADERQMAAAHTQTRAALDAAREQVAHVRAQLLTEEARMLDARAHVNPRAKRSLDAAARRLRKLATDLDGENRA